jgi:hypothetical protein
MQRGDLAAGFSDAAHHLGGVDGGPILAARVYPLRREGQEEILPNLQPLIAAQLGEQDFPRGARVGGRFQDHHHAGVDVFCQ